MLLHYPAAVSSASARIVPYRPARRLSMAQLVEPVTTLGSVVALGDEYGVVWHRTCDTLRVLPIKQGRGALPLSPANEVALHLPAGLPGWGIVFDELVSWSRVLCAIVGELDERCLLKAACRSRRPTRR